MGDGGLAECKELLQPDAAAFAYVRIVRAVALTSVMERPTERV